MIGKVEPVKHCLEIFDQGSSKILFLTDEVISELKTGRKVEQWTDASVSGLYLKVTRNGAKTFWCRRNLRNKRIEFHYLGRWPALKISEARNSAQILRMQPIKPLPATEPLLGKRDREQLLDALRHQADYPTARDCIHLWLLIGYALKSEIVRMKWEHLDLESGIWVLKSNAQLILPVAAVGLLRRRREAVARDCPWVFPTESRYSKKAGHLNFPRRPLLKLLLRIGVSGDIAGRIAGARGTASF